MKIQRLTSIAAVLLAVGSLTACVAPGPVYQAGAYPYQQAQPVPYPSAQGPYVEYGRVANIEVIRGQTQGSGTTGGGAVAGGLIGGVVGHQFGQGSGNTAATVLGAVGGALLGNSIEANQRAPRGYESYRVSIQTENGAYRAFDVPTPGDLRIGDRVRIDNGQISRY